jgi:hypothetical protein
VHAGKFGIREDHLKRDTRVIIIINGINMGSYACLGQALISGSCRNEERMKALLLSGTHSFSGLKRRRYRRGRCRDCNEGGRALSHPVGP